MLETLEDGQREESKKSGTSEENMDTSYILEKLTKLNQVPKPQMTSIQEKSWQ